MDIICGDAQICALALNGTTAWCIHGGRILFDYHEALAYAQRVNNLMQKLKGGQ